MRTVLPGKPQSTLQAVSIGLWGELELIVYISGNAVVILSDPATILQTIYDDDFSDLTAVAIDEASGKVAACTKRSVRIYRPYGHDDGALKWSLQGSIEAGEIDGNIASLSWGGAGELLVGSANLALYTIENDIECIWSKQLANSSKFSALSYDSCYIASTGAYDRLVKLWRRLSFGSHNVRFDLAYLPHPQTVTSVRWRRPYHQNQTVENVLYTIAADQIVRVWASTDPHGLRIFQLWGQIDLNESIQPRSLTPREDGVAPRYAFMMDFRDFSRAAEYAVETAKDQGHGDDDAVGHIIEVANRSPEVCVVLDECGNMSAWGIENIGGKERKTSDIFNIAHVSNLDPTLVSAHTPGDMCSQILSYCTRKDGRLIILVHKLDGSIDCFDSNIARLFDPLQRKGRLRARTVLAGHSSAIKKIVRNNSGRAVVSRTDGNETIVWRHEASNDATSLAKQSSIHVSQHIHRISVIRRGNFVVLLHHAIVSLWDCRRSQSKLLGSCAYDVRGKPLCILLLPEIGRDRSVAHIATITSEMKGVVWELLLPTQDVSDRDAVGKVFIKEFCTLNLGDADDLAYVLPVDPAGSPPVRSGFLDTFARDMAISYTHSGLVRSWTAKVDIERRKVDFLLTCSVDTGIIEPALASGSSIRKAALVNAHRSELTIWDVKGAQLEFTQSFEPQESIQDLDWTSTPDDQSILAVGFRHRVILLSQLRYDYVNKGPAWTTIREINIRDLTPHPIGDSTWLGSGSLLIGAGNQLFVFDKLVTVPVSTAAALQLPVRKKGLWGLFEIVTRLNGPLPVFHPQFLSQCILAGKTIMVQHILLKLYKALKYHVEGEAIADLLGIQIEAFYEPGFEARASQASKKDLRLSAFADFAEEEDPEVFTESIAASLNEKLTTVDIAQLSNASQIHLADIVECVAMVEKQRRSMDGNAARFMLFHRQHALHKGRANELSLSWREINWAYHSGSQDILIDVVSRQVHGRTVWENARESGMFMWITDATALREQFEIVARNEYTKTEEKNPIDCSLFYLALKKKAVLQGLWRMAGWNREQAATQKLLQNNFQDQKWRTVALKNAYALLGKHRFEYAAAFFLLADSLRDAVNVCLNQLKDIQLAIAITRIYEGEKGPVLRELLEDRILPLAAQEGNRWLASWAFWMLHRRDMAVRALISPMYTLLETPSSPDMQSKLYLTDDPALIILYSQLRQKTLQTLRGASKVTPRVEWAFVMHSARLYDRMGCDILALDLVRNWEFLLSGTSLNALDEANPRFMLRRRSSLVIQDLPVNGFATAAKPSMHKDKDKRAPPTQFVEPESSSLLDSFGF